MRLPLLRPAALRALALALPLVAPLGAPHGAIAAPKVATDIAPVHSLVASIMEGAGAPGLILPPDASPHHHSLRPSEAATLAGAEIVIGIGPALTPWLSEAAARMAPGAQMLTLLSAADLDAAAGHGAAHEGHGAEAHADHGGHDDHAGHDDDHGHGNDDHDHDDHGHDDHGRDDHAGGDHDDAHDHGGVDPHAWLDPRAAAAWAAPIADALSAADPENAALYAANAARLRAELSALEAELAATLAPLKNRPYVVYHDAFGWFERRFGLTRLGAAAEQDGARPAPARVALLRDALAGAQDPCIFAEPQHSDRLLRALTESGAVRLGRIDPLGVGLEPGPALYPGLLRGVAASMAACLAP